QNVAAEDGVEQSLERPWLDQVEPAECNQRPKLVTYGEALIAIDRMQVGSERVRNFLQCRRRILAGRSFGENVGIDVARQDFDVVAADVGDLAAQHQGNRVRLLPSRAAGGPDAQPPPAGTVGCMDEGTGDVRSEVREVVLFPEKLGVVGRDAVDEPFDLPLAVGTLEIIAVLTERRKPERTQAP